MLTKNKCCQPSNSYENEHLFQVGGDRDVTSTNNAIKETIFLRGIYECTTNDIPKWPLMVNGYI